MGCAFRTPPRGPKGIDNSVSNCPQWMWWGILDLQQARRRCSIGDFLVLLSMSLCGATFPCLRESLMGWGLMIVPWKSYETDSADLLCCIHYFVVVMRKWLIFQDFSVIFENQTLRLSLSVWGEITPRKIQVCLKSVVEGFLYILLPLHTDFMHSGV